MYYGANIIPTMMPSIGHRTNFFLHYYSLMIMEKRTKYLVLLILTFNVPSVLNTSEPTF